jgi:DNA-binding beta-propeller fold protein YncE
LRWTIPRRATVRDPRWSPSGNRVAYRSGSSLRLAAGDASSDAQIDSSVSRVAPAWRPIANLTPAPIQTGPGVNVLAYVDSDHRVVVLNTDTGTILLRSAPQPVPFELAWSSDGKHLLAVTRRSLYTYAPTKPGPPVTASLNRNQTLRSAAFIPGSRGVVATIQTRTHGQVRSAVMSGRPDVEAFLHRRLFGGPGRLTDVVPAPDGSSVLVALPDADQWLFIDPVGGKVTAVDHIARQFDPGASGPVAFPHVEGWCCAASTGG